MKSVETYEAKIFVGLMEGYSGELHCIDEVELLCQSYVDAIGGAVTVTSTKFIYTGGKEPGAIIGFINYPRFPKDTKSIKEQALKLAEILKVALGQIRVSIVCSDETIMLGPE